jgi:endonuclease/exonuclease/phosphatase family metal-dependent hydrolase
LGGREELVVRARILTFNTLYRGDARARIRALGSVLDESDYDIVCLQELWSPPNLALLRSLTPSYRHAAHGLRFPMVAGGLAVLSRIPIVGHRYARFPWHGPARKELLSRKGVLVTRFSIDDRFLTVVNTHLSANSKADWSRSQSFTKVQQAELREVAAAVRRIESGEPVVMVGDFNVPRESWLFDEFVTDSGLIDTFQGSPDPTFRPTPRWPGAALDQVLVSSGLTASPELVLKDSVRLADGRAAYLSDHFGIGVTVETGASSIPEEGE